MKGISAVQAERDSTNAPANDLPPVLPHQLIKLRGREFSQIILKHLEHLKAFWMDDDIDRIEREFRELLNAYKYEQALELALSKCDDSTGFEDGWAIIGNRLLHSEIFVEA